MSEPKINFCVVCEGVRTELGNKGTILGFYGVLPHVTIRLGELNKPVQVLVFAVGLRGESEEISISASVLRPNGDPLVALDDKSFPPLPLDAGALAAFVFAPIVFEQTGWHSFQLFMNGKEQYRETFEILVDSSLFTK